MGGQHIESCEAAGDEGQGEVRGGARSPERVLLPPNFQGGLGPGREEEAQYVLGAHVKSSTGDAWRPVVIVLVGPTMFVYDYMVPLVCLRAEQVQVKRALDDGTDGHTAMSFAPCSQDVYVRAVQASELKAVCPKMEGRVEGRRRRPSTSAARARRRRRRAAHARGGR